MPQHQHDNVARFQARAQFESYTGDAYPELADLETDPMRPWVNPASLTSQERSDLLKKIDRRDVVGVRMVARAFRDAPNVNGFRPEPGRLAELAQLAGGAPYLSTHDRTVKNISGEIIGAFSRPTGPGGEDELYLAQEVTEPSEMAAFVRNERREFSIGFVAERWECTACATEALMSPWGPIPTCDCEGAEIFGMGALRFDHNAAVFRGAVRGTRPEDPRRFGLFGQTHTTEGEKMPVEKTPATATPEAASDHTAALAAKDARIAALEAQVDAAEKARLVAAFEAAVAAHRCDAAELPAFEKMRGALGVDFALAQLEARKPMASRPTEPVGLGASHYPEPEKPKPEDTAALRDREDWALCEHLVASGRYTQEQLDALKKRRAL